MLSLSKHGVGVFNGLLGGEDERSPYCRPFCSKLIAELPPCACT